MPIITETGALRAWWAMLMVLVAAFLVAAACILYTNRAQHASDQRWCALLNSLDQPSAPPTNERGRIIQRQIHQLRDDFGCGGGR
jgi:hypothetical protein